MKGYGIFMEWYKTDVVWCMWQTVEGSKGGEVG